MAIYSSINPLTRFDAREQNTPFMPQGLVAPLGTASTTTKPWLTPENVAAKFEPKPLTTTTSPPSISDQLGVTSDPRPPAPPYTMPEVGPRPIDIGMWNTDSHQLETGGGTGGVTTATPIDPENSLRGQQLSFNPTNSGLFGQMNQFLSRFFGQGGSDRSALINERFAAQVPFMNQQAAAMGRMGSGLVNQSMQRELARITAEESSNEFQDNLNALSAGRGLTSDQFGRDVTQHGFNLGERGYQDQLARQAVQDQLQMLGLFGNFMGESYPGAPREYGDAAQMYGSQAASSGDQASNLALLAYLLR